MQAADSLPSSDEVHNESRSDMFVSKGNIRFRGKEGWPEGQIE
jgi:hypothetical protein